MPQRHLDQLSAVDAAFLHQEGATTHMHIGGLVTLGGPAADIEQFRAHIASRLPIVPRYRQKIADVPLGLGRQRWVDDPRFNLDYHVRHTALPAPGDEAALLRLTSRIFAQPLDRTKPLWELWVVEGLQDGRWAVLSKTHHSLVDGVAGVDLMTMLFDVSPTPRKVKDGDAWQPRPEPSGTELAAAGVASAVRRAIRTPMRVVNTIAGPGHTLADAREAALGLGEVIWSGLNPPPQTPLNVPIGPHRRFEVVRAQLSDFRTVKNAFGGTVNDVVLAVVAGGLARFFHSRGIRTEGLELQACVPVSIRSEDERGAGGNKLTQIIAPLPVYIADPVARLQTVKRAMDGLKESKQAIGAEVIASAQDFAPPTILAQASRLNFSGRFYNLLVTNVPGPQMPLYILGHELEDVFPVPFLAGDRTLAIAIMSYNGQVGFGLLGDLDALGDLDVIAEGISESLAELVALARDEEQPGMGLKPKPRRRPAKRAAAKSAAGNGAPAKRAGAKRPAAAKPAAAKKRTSAKR